MTEDHPRPIQVSQPFPRLALAVIRILYHLLYHQLAWTYDLVAAVVSLGRWPRWVATALPYLQGRVLEIGYGPGHLQAALSGRGQPSFGLDESRQMAHQAGKLLRKNGAPVRLSRGYAQSLPFLSGSFDTVAATFPTEYIFDPKTLGEAWRVLTPDGRLVIVPLAWVTGTRPLERLAAWFFRISGEAPGRPGPLSAEMVARIEEAGYRVRSELVETPGSQILVVVAKKTISGEKE